MTLADWLIVDGLSLQIPTTGVRAGRNGCRSSLRRAFQAAWSVRSRLLGSIAVSVRPEGTMQWERAVSRVRPGSPVWARQRISPSRMP